MWKFTRLDSTLKKCLVGVLLLMLVGSGVAAVQKRGSAQETFQQELVLLEQGIRIRAPKETIQTYLDAYARKEDPEVLEELLNEIRADPKNVVIAIQDEEDPVPVLQEEPVVQVEAERTA